MKKPTRLVIAIVIAEFAGVIGSVFTSPSIPSWFASLAKPSFSPPNWIFAPVWTALFALMGISFYLIWDLLSKSTDASKKRNIRKAISIYFVQLALNVIWSIIFFGLHDPGAAFIEIVMLWFAIIVTIAIFYKISKTASYLLLPYLAWVSFAAYLNYAIWQLNRMP